MDTGLKVAMVTGPKEQEDVEAMEVVELMDVVIPVSSLNLGVGVAIGEEHRVVELMDIRGLIMVVV